MATSPVTTAMLGQALKNATPSTALLAQQDADARAYQQQLQTQGGDTRSWGQLLANLAGQYLVHSKVVDSDKAVMAGQARDRQATADYLLKSSGAAPSVNPDQASSSIAPPAPAATSSPVVAASPGTSDTPLSTAAEAPAAPVSTMTPDNQLALARTVWGEARGEPAAGQQAVASVILNRSKNSGQPVSSIVSAPHQFGGYNSTSQSIAANDPRLAPIMANIGGLTNGTMQPTTNADHFYAPSGMPGGKPPAWDNGTGTRIGNQVFLHLDPSNPQAAQPQMAQAQSPTPPAQPPMQPFQVASNGPLTPGMMPQQAPPPAPPPSAGAGGGAPPPQGVAPQAGGGAPTGIPTGPGATPQEADAIRTGLSSMNPQIFAAAQALAQKVADRRMSPVELNKDEAYNPDGSVRNIGPKFQDVAGPVNAYTQRGPDNQIHTTANPAYGSLPAGTMLGANGIQQVTSQQRQTFRIPGASGLYVNDAQGNPQKVADDEYGPAQLAALREGVLKSQQYDDYAKSKAGYDSMVALAKQNPSGITGYALKDAAARTFNPQGAVRLSTIDALNEAPGLPQRLKGALLSLQDQGNVPPEVVQNYLDAALPFAQSHYAAANALNQDNVGYAKRHNINPSDVTADIGPAPERYVMATPHAQPSPSPGPGNSGQSGGAAPRQMSPDEVRSLPKGTRFLGTDNIWRIRQ